MAGFEARDVPTDPIAATSSGRCRTDGAGAVDEDVVERALLVLEGESRDWTAEQQRKYRQRHDGRSSPGPES